MKEKIRLLWYLLTVIPILLIILGYLFPSAFFSSQDSIRNFVQQFGVLAPLAFILLQIIQVIITPISHYTVSIAGGFIFGTWAGFMYNWIGRVVGTLIAFYIGRKFGRRIIQRFVKKENLKKYDLVFEKGKFLLFIMYFLPLFPDDEISYLAGFSSIKSKFFIPIIILGHIGGSLGLSCIGNRTSYKDPLFMTIILLTLILGIMFAVFYKRLKKYY